MNSNQALLPSWVHALSKSIQLKLSEFEAILDCNDSEQDNLSKAEILSNAMCLLLEIENFAERYKTFIKQSGINELKLDLENQISTLGKKGVSFKIKRPDSIANVLFVDTETTGVGQHDEPISIAAVLTEVNVNSGSITNEVATYYGLREPFCEINQEAFKVHGLTKASLKGKEFDIRELYCMFNVANLIVAHNAKFDKRMLRFLSDESHNWGCSCWDLDWPLEIGGRSLVAICEYFSIEKEFPHNALSDTRAMMTALQQKSQNNQTYLKLLINKTLNIK